MAYSDEQIQALVSQYGACVYRFAMALMQAKPDADDVYEEVFLRLIRTRPELEGPARRKAWLLQATATCCMEFLKNAPRRDLPQDEQEDPQERDTLQAALDDLDAQTRCLIHLFYYEGYRTEEIAEILDIKTSKVRAGLNRARKKLKKFMEGGQE